MADNSIPGPSITNPFQDTGLSTANFLQMSSNATERDTLSVGAYAPEAPTKLPDGFNAIVYHGPNNQIVIAFGGKPPGFSSYYKDEAQFLSALIAKTKGLPPSQFVEAADLFTRVVNSAGHGAHVYVTGWGLGGLLAQYVAINNPNLVEGGQTFGAPGVGVMADVAQQLDSVAVRQSGLVDRQRRI